MNKIVFLPLQLFLI